MATTKFTITAEAAAVGLLLASSGTSDIVDAQVIVCARRAGLDLDRDHVGRNAGHVRVES